MTVNAFVLLKKEYKHLTSAYLKGKVWSDRMLAKNHRLRAAKDIQRVSRQGRWAAGSNLTIRTLPNRFQTVRVGVIISKKVDKRAVVRNRARRRVQEQLRLILPNLIIGSDILIYIRKDLVDLKPEQLKNELDIQLKRLRVVKG